MLRAKRMRSPTPPTVWVVHDSSPEPGEIVESHRRSHRRVAAAPPPAETNAKRQRSKAPKGKEGAHALAEPSSTPLSSPSTSKAPRSTALVQSVLRFGAGPATALSAPNAHSRPGSNAPSTGSTFDQASFGGGLGIASRSPVSGGLGFGFAAGTGQAFGAGSSFQKNTEATAQAGAFKVPTSAPSPTAPGASSSAPSSSSVPSSLSGPSCSSVPSSTSPASPVSQIGQAPSTPPSTFHPRPGAGTAFRSSGLAFGQSNFAQPGNGDPRPVASAATVSGRLGFSSFAGSRSPSLGASTTPPVAGSSSFFKFGVGSDNAFTFSSANASVFRERTVATVSTAPQVGLMTDGMPAIKAENAALKQRNWKLEALVKVQQALIHGLDAEKRKGGGVNAGKASAKKVAAERKAKKREKRERREKRRRLHTMAAPPEDDEDTEPTHCKLSCDCTRRRHERMVELKAVKDCRLRAPCGMCACCSKDMVAHVRAKLLGLAIPQIPDFEDNPQVKAELVRARTHLTSAATFHDSYEELEHVGDSVLETSIRDVTTGILEIPDGKFSNRLRIWCVRNTTLAALCECWGLHDKIIVTEGARKVLNETKLRADVAEAHIGALYRTMGFDWTDAFLRTVYAPIIALLKAEISAERVR